MKAAVAGAAATVLIAGAAAVYFLYLAPGHIYIYVEDAPRFTSVYLTFSYVALHSRFHGPPLGRRVQRL